MDWIDPIRNQVQKIFNRVLTRSLEAALEAGDLIVAEEFAHEMVTMNPYCEKAALELVRVLVRQGQREEAIQAYHRYRRKLELDLGLPPDQSITEKFIPWLSGGEILGDLQRPGKVEDPERTSDEC
jgi:DNA-binding SARP family transcriptional activator